jgi:hypothetical protein
MKRFVLALLITLTVFRGFIGDAMAFEMSARMASMAVAGSAAQDGAHQHAQSAMPCHSMDEDGGLPEHMNACNTCQVCHLSAFVSMSAFGAWRDQPVAAPQVCAESFASAEALRLSKPPIS